MFRGMFISLGMIISKVTAFDLSNADINMVTWLTGSPKQILRIYSLNFSKAS